MIIRPTHRLFSMRFRTAWPLKGCIELASESEGLRMVCTKRVPWSSSILTLLWFSLVGFGTLGFLITYVLQGGLESLGSVLLGIGVTGVGLIVVAFGLLTVTVAYRIENTRLMLVYTELRAVAVDNERAGQRP
jgi:TM2 domain-containing membrane protein YozV